MCSDQLPSNHALLVDDVGFGKPKAAVQGVRGLFLIEDGHQVDVVLRDVILILSKLLIAVDRNYLNLRQFMLKSFEAGHLLDAGGAPTRPEIEDDYLTAQISEIYRMLAVADDKYGSFAADLTWMGIAIAA